jgi:hypothetical protein
MRELKQKLLKILWTEEDDLENDFVRLYFLYSVGVVVALYIIYLLMR